MDRRETTEQMAERVLSEAVGSEIGKAARQIRLLRNVMESQRMMIDAQEDLIEYLHERLEGDD